MDITITKTSVEDWKALDFVNYFYLLRSAHYATDKLNKTDTLHAECMRVKYLMRLFTMYNKSKHDFQTFVTWAVNKYVTDTTYVLPPQIGYLSATARGYLGLPPKSKAKKKKREKIILDDSMQQWIKEQKKKLKERDAKRRA